MKKKCNFSKNFRKKQDRSKSSLLEMEGDIEGKTGKQDEPRREVARPFFTLFFTAGKKFRPPPLYFVTAQNGRSIKGGSQYVYLHVYLDSLRSQAPAYFSVWRSTYP